MVFVLVFNSCGLPVFYWVKIQLCKVKAELAEMERESTQTPVVFSEQTKGLQQVGSDELQVDGKMYDVVHTRVRNGIKYYYAVGDGDEDAYIHKLQDTEKGNLGTNPMSAKTLKGYELKCVAVVKIAPTPFIPKNQPVQYNRTAAPLIYLSHFKDIFSPPPDRFLS